MASRDDKHRAANALEAIAKSIRGRRASSSMHYWVDRGRGDGYYVRVTLPDDIFIEDTTVLVERPSCD